MMKTSNLWDEWIEGTYKAYDYDKLKTSLFSDCTYQAFVSETTHFYECENYNYFIKEIDFIDKLLYEYECDKSIAHWFHYAVEKNECNKVSSYKFNCKIQIGKFKNVPVQLGISIEDKKIKLYSDFDHFYTLLDIDPIGYSTKGKKFNSRIFDLLQHTRNEKIIDLDSELHSSYSKWGTTRNVNYEELKNQINVLKMISNFPENGLFDEYEKFVKEKEDLKNKITSLEQKIFNVFNDRLELEQEFSE